ncbi:MAG: excinuclease ABC subunit UvrC [Alphaproteobacteria bacterium]|nr:excinuclease ABC subunit UvrC [Alphaproteobacteria bacterium]
MNNTQDRESLQAGTALIRDYTGKLPDTPGVYRMLGAGGEALYVGKAKSLKKRVLSYTQGGRLPVRLQRMVALTKSMEFIHTATEAEALLLESNLIKKLKPRYNILLRDDKSFPYILLTGDHDFPQVVKHRGAQKRKGRYYGPFAGAGEVNRTITALQKVFMLRNCSDSVFANRTRPCLQYHIKRCTAPCVGKVGKDEYAAQVAEAEAFLEGKSSQIQERYAAIMQEASAAENFEKAALYRDRIKALSFVQGHQDINVAGAGLKDADILGLHMEGGRSCVQIFFFRGGQNTGNRAYYPKHDPQEGVGAILSAFMAQFYENKVPPPEVIVSHAPDEARLLQEALESRAGRKVKITQAMRGTRARLLAFVLDNAQKALERETASRQREEAFLEAVAVLFGMEEAPCRIEIYDNSHIAGTNMVGAMVVSGPEGFVKKAYRKFNIREAKAADDYGMMREVMRRRFKRALQEEEDTGTRENWPDLLLIDGGRGQFNAVKAELEELGVADRVALVSIAKGEDRNAGRETFFVEGRAPFQLPEKDSTLHYLQRLRDEAHRFAIGSHRARRKKQISASPLDEIEGIGAARKKALLLYFGSAKAVAGASAEDLEKIEGISKAIAQKIYEHFH